MNITLHQLKIFIHIAQYQSITQAANTLYLSQPAVSMQLKRLQEQFDAPLVEIIGRQLHITEFGEEVLELASQIDSIASELENISNRDSDHLVGRIKINSVSTGKYILPYFINNFFNEHEALELSLDVTNRGTVIHNLVENTIDFALVSIPPDNLSYSELSLFQNRLYLVISSEHPKRNNSDIIHEVPIILREKGSGTRMLIERFISQQKIKKLKLIELQSNEAVKQAVIAGLGMSIIPIESIKNELNLGQLKIIPYQGLPLESHWRIIWPKGKKHSISAQALLDHIKKEKNSIIQSQFSWTSERPELKYSL